MFFSLNTTYPQYPGTSFFFTCTAENVSPSFFILTVTLLPLPAFPMNLMFLSTPTNTVFASLDCSTTPSLYFRSECISFFLYPYSDSASITCISYEPYVFVNSNEYCFCVFGLLNNSFPVFSVNQFLLLFVGRYLKRWHKPCIFKLRPQRVYSLPQILRGFYVLQ